MPSCTYLRVLTGAALVRSSPSCNILQGALRIAHCGGFHSVLNTLVEAINLVAKLMRHPIHWDTETIGCNPSLSSIAVLDQRTFKDALQEIALWLARPENADEFLVLYLDDQPDLLEWVRSLIIALLFVVSCLALACL